MQQAQDEIMQTYAVPMACSSDLSDKIVITAEDIATPPKTPRNGPPSRAKGKTTLRQTVDDVEVTPSTKRARLRTQRGNATPKKPQAVGLRYQ